VKDKDKTQKELMTELTGLRQRLPELEALEAEHKRAEEALRLSEKKYRQLIENAQEGIWAIDAEAKTTFVNHRMAEILGYTIDEMLGSSLFLFMDERGVALAKHYFERRKQGIKERHDFQFLRKDGTRVYTSLETSPIMDDAGDFMGAFAFVPDITERKRAEEPLKRAAFETLEALSRLVEANDPYTSGHSAMVNEIAITIAQKMELMDSQLDTLGIAGPLHDVGKVGIPSSVLNKPTGLTEAEWVMIRAHPRVSANVAQQVTAFAAAVPAIRHHHERWDGTGYPDGLKGDDIPLLARILAVADGFQAMTSERPYRRARTEEETLAELQKGAGTQWDPEVVKVFLKLRKPPTKRKGKGKRKSGK